MGYVYNITSDLFRQFISIADKNAKLEGIEILQSVQNQKNEFVINFI